MSPLPPSQVAVSKEEQDSTLAGQEKETTMYMGREGGQTSSRRSPRQAPHGTSLQQDGIFGGCQLPELRGTLLSAR